MSRSRLYMLIAGIAFLSYTWVVLNLNSIALNICFFKHFTSLACPACGTTQSVLSILEGNFHLALMTNPMGLLAFLLLIVTPIWLLVDLLTGKATLHSFYINTEKRIKNKYLFVPLIFFTLMNWAWNIMKNL